MSRFTRRRFLAATGIAAAAGAARQLTGPTSAQAAPLKLEPEKGAVLRVLRRKRFVQGDEELFMANTRRYTQLTGVEVCPGAIRATTKHFSPARSADPEGGGTAGGEACAAALSGLTRTITSRAAAI